MSEPCKFCGGDHSWLMASPFDSGSRYVTQHPPQEWIPLHDFERLRNSQAALMATLHESRDALTYYAELHPVRESAITQAMTAREAIAAINAVLKTPATI